MSSRTPCPQPLVGLDRQTGLGGCRLALEHRPSPPYLLLPQARIWLFTVRTMEESIPQMTL